MKLARFFVGQRHGDSVVVVIYMIVVTALWVATLLDYAFNLGWGMHRQGLWAGPMLLILGAVLQFCRIAMMKFLRGIR